MGYHANMSESASRAQIIKLGNETARMICRRHSEGLSGYLEDYRLAIKGGTARNALLEYLGLPAEASSRDIDLCAIEGYTASRVPTVGELRRANPKVESIDHCGNMAHFMADSDFTANQALLAHDGIYATRKAILDIINGKLSPSYSELGSHRNSLRALLFLTRYDLEPTKALESSIRSLLANNIESFSFQLLVILLKAAEMGISDEFVVMLGKYGLPASFHQLFIRCLLLAWDFDLMGREPSAARALYKSGFDIGTLPDRERGVIMRDYPELYNTIGEIASGDYRKGAAIALGGKRLTGALGEIDLPESRWDILSTARVMKLNRMVK